ncbi:hypothetical protein V8C86DRAFT_2522234 [Haematococcus lacustris]
MLQLLLLTRWRHLLLPLGSQPLVGGRVHAHVRLQLWSLECEWWTWPHGKRGRLLPQLTLTRLLQTCKPIALERTRVKADLHACLEGGAGADV